MISIDGKVVDFSKFPNGETLFNHNSLDALEGYIPQRVFFKWEDDSDFVKLTILKDYMDSIGVEPEELLIAYMPYSRMDRSENGSPFTLKSVAKLINRLNFKDVYVIEPHSDVTCAVLDNASPVYINPMLLRKVKQAVDFQEKFDYIVFPDAGAQKRYAKSITARNQLVGFKHRDFETSEIKSLEIVGNIVEGAISKAIIADDLSSYGGTFIKTANALRVKGIEEVFLLVAHAENSIFKKELFNHVDGVFTTDTLLTEHKDNWTTAKFKNKLTVFNIEEII